jgi:CxxC motif-containing protein (DUF1111 family)
MRSLRRAAVLVIVAPVVLPIAWAARGGRDPWAVAAGTAEPPPAAGPEGAQAARGRELFLRHWLPNDPRARGGDGLGPLYNATACIDCHRQGGPGGAGPADRNVDVVTLKGRFTVTPSDPSSPGDLDDFHPGFRTANSVVLHQYSTDPGYRAWRLRRVDGVEHADMAETGGDAERDMVRETVLKGDPAPRSSGRKLLDPPGPRPRGRVTGTQLLGEVATLTQRNTPALFGTGLLDAIPVASLEEAARGGGPGVRGRLNRLSDGRPGRFGWKAQTASLRDFVMSACAVELGLEVPGHHQARPPLDVADKGPAKFDLDEDDCAALTTFVAGLPAPAEPRLPDPEGGAVRAGRARFVAIGCAGCHRPALGPVAGLYSDLLLHDLGPDLSDGGGAYDGPKPSGGAKPQEWRTPPLWGFRDSGPYLHDGRARTLEQAVALHGGQAERSSRSYFALTPVERLEVEAFLNSLVAPD